METNGKTRVFGFVSLSTFFHAGLFLAITIYTVDYLKNRELPPVVEVEVTENQPLTVPTKGEQLTTPTLTPEPLAEAPLPKAATLQPNKMPAKLVKALPPPKSMAPTKKSAKINSPTSSTVAMQPTAMQPTVVTQPIDTTDLEEAPTVVVAPELKDSDIAEDLDKVDKETNAQTATELAEIKKAADQEAEKAIKTHEAELAKIEKQNKEQDEIKAAEAVEMGKQERADANALAEAEALRNSQAKMQQAEQANAAKAFGTAEGVRPLEDLKQRIGNKKPAYDNDDRFHQRQGEIIFQSYISNEGVPSEFKLIKSTGHRSLDLKTLSALKQWRFQPGQQGWVEIPFKWDLIGGPQEMPSSLRRKVGQTN